MRFHKPFSNARTSTWFCSMPRIWACGSSTRILGIEQNQVDVLAFENGLWNRISGQDMQSELSILPQLAREKAAESDLPAKAERALQQQIEQRVHAPQPLHLIFEGGTANEAR